MTKIPFDLIIYLGQIDFLQKHTEALLKVHTEYESILSTNKDDGSIAGKLNALDFLIDTAKAKLNSLKQTRIDYFINKAKPERDE